MPRSIRKARDQKSDSDSGNEIYDSNGIKHTTPRSLKKINYAEIENSYEHIDELGHEEDNSGEVIIRKNVRVLGPEDDVEEEQVGVRKTRGKCKRGTYFEEDGDESFHEDEDENEGSDFDDGESSDEEEKKRWRKRRKRQFVVHDDDEYDKDEDEEYEAKPTSRSRRNRSRMIGFSSRRLRTCRTRSSAFSEEEDEDGVRKNTRREVITLEEELRELQEDSPIKEKRSLRERTKPVNYTLPPALSENQLSAAEFTDLAASTTYKSARGKHSLHTGQSFRPVRRLFPTGGPFGGNDVTAIFGKNNNFYENNQDSIASNNKFIDSDSSDDEILPIGATVEHRSVSGSKKKKKPEIADLDPLGVDMNIKFEDIGGLDNYIDQLKEMVALPLLYPELYQNFNITIPRGVLFHGPPGTGKTLMARALAASCSTDKIKITFFMRKGADILSKWVGEAERQLRLLFEEAKKHQPSIIFFDEIDGLAPVRSSKQEQIHASIVSTMLALMDGMDSRGRVIVIGATNRPDAVDPALRRPGRFDREFYFPLPDQVARYKILEIHTKKWNPLLPKPFLEKLASLTKGYGGADLRALCTEAVLISIQRKYPQIYQSDSKLEVDPTKIKIKPKDFMLAMEKLIPSSARISGSNAEPLPQTVEVLLKDQFEEVKQKLDFILPRNNSKPRRGASMIEYYLEYDDDDDNDDDSNDFSAEFKRQELLKRIEKARVVKPKLLVTGPTGNGQQYIGSAILHYFEDVNVQTLDLGTLSLESLRSIESAIIKMFIEAKKHEPSIIYIPNADIWAKSVPENAILLLSGLFRSLKSNAKILLLALAENLSEKELAKSPLALLGLDMNIFTIREPSPNQRYLYFKSISELLSMKPSVFYEAVKRRKPLPKLPKKTIEVNINLDENGVPLSEEELIRRELKSFQHQDMKLKNSLKIKLSGLMDFFKGRYKRFRKPPIDDSFLVHLFEPEAFESNPNWEPTYVKEGSMILEISTGKKYFNMDLDIIEERLWNGFYSEPKQYLKDIELIYRDSNVSGDRERIIKASEMFANAQMGIEEISTPEFIAECKSTRKRELQRQELFKKEKGLNKETNKHEAGVNEINLNHADVQVLNSSEPLQLGVGGGLQLQMQQQLNPENQPESTSALQNPDYEASSLSKKEDTEVTLKIPETGGDTNPCTTIPIETNTNKKKVINDEFMDETILETKVKKKEHQKELKINNNVFEEIISMLESKTQDFTVEQLETCYAAVLEIVWEERLSWDKTSALMKIKKYIGI